jgi:hypothetical protein
MTSGITAKSALELQIELTNNPSAAGETSSPKPIHSQQKNEERYL